MTLEVIHQYVEVLDRYFGNVCELDIIFNFHKVSSPLWRINRATGRLRKVLLLQLPRRYLILCYDHPSLCLFAGLLHPGRAVAGRGAAGDQQEGGAASMHGAGRPDGGGRSNYQKEMTHQSFPMAAGVSLLETLQH